jgi:hypothetical protein
MSASFYPKLAALFILLLLLSGFLAFYSYFYRTNNSGDFSSLPPLIRLENSKTDIAYGLSFVNPDSITIAGVWHSRIAGVLLEKPELDSQGYVVFKIGIPVGEKLIPLIVAEQPHIIEEEKVLYVTYVRPYQPGVSPSISRLIPVSQALDEFGSSVGRQVAFEFLFGEYPDYVESYIRSTLMSTPGCVAGCMSRYLAAISSLPKNFAVYESLASGRGGFDNMKFSPVITKTYLQP